MIADFLDMMPSVVTYAKVDSRDQYGKPTHGPAVIYKAHIAHTTRRVSSRVTGQDVLSSVQVHISGIIAEPDVDDKLTLLAGSLADIVSVWGTSIFGAAVWGGFSIEGTTPSIISWDIVDDEAGHHHMKLYCGGV